MPKLNLNTIDKIESYEFERAQIFTNNYDAKIKPSTTHVPTAAKIVLRNKDVLTLLIAELPIVLCNQTGDIQVFTQTPFELATLKSLDDFKRKFNRKILKEEVAVLQAKSVFGLTPEEVVRFKVTEAKLELHKIISKLPRPAEGGGL